MEFTVNIFNPSTGNSKSTIDYLRNTIAKRRKSALNLTGRKDIEKQITVMTTNKDLQQVAAHYKSFEISSMNIEKAVEVFNAGGGEIATIL